MLRTLVGPGRVHLSGGHAPARSLVLEFRASRRGVNVIIDNQWGTSDHDHYAAQARISEEAFDGLVDRLLQVSESDHEPPTMSDFGLGVGFVLPLEEGSVIGAASDFVEGVSPATLADAVLELVDEIEDEPSFDVVLPEDLAWYDESEARPRRNPLLSFMTRPATLVRVAASVVVGFLHP